MTMLLQMQATLLQLVILLISGHIAASNSIVTTLPGFSGDLPFKLETGYVGVGDEDDAQLFYSFVESNYSPLYDPLVLWVSGGPGCSAFNALFFENVGPLIFDYENSTSDDPKLLLNPYSWTQFVNMIYLDAPVGTGFSYAKTWKNESSMSDTLSAADTYEFLQKWFVDHPDFLKNPLYVAGDSYAGILVPMIVQHISDGIEAGLEPQMNLKGYILGNPVTVHKRETYDQVQFSHQLGLISDDLYQSLQTNCEGDFTDIDQKNASCVDDYALFIECVQDIYFPQILEPACTLETLTSMGSNGEPNDLSKKDSADLLLTFRELPRRWCRELHYVYMATWANIKSVQEALHVQEGSITEWVRCNGTLKASYDTDISSSVVYHENLIKKGYKVLIYSGDHDLIMPYVGTIAWIESLNLTVDSRWRPWFVDGQVAGYTVVYKREEYKLTYATVKGGGHTAPEFRPEECLSMMSRWFAYYPL